MGHHKLHPVEGTLSTKGQLAKEANKRNEHRWEQIWGTT